MTTMTTWKQKQIKTKNDKEGNIVLGVIAFTLFTINIIQLSNLL